MLLDIYFEEKYACLHERMYNAISDTFVFECNHGKIYYSFLIREIPLKANGKTYYDIITPYGYGGPIILEIYGSRQKLLNYYHQAFSEYCKSKDIVSEFIRFHPLVKNHFSFKEIYKIEFVRQTVATRLTCEDPFTSEFSKGARKTTRQALKKGFTWEIIESPSELELFKKVYKDTMDRNKASDFYYFDDYYFADLINYFSDHLLNINVFDEDKCISSGLFFVYNQFMHAHLSGTIQQYLRDNPAYLLKYLSVEWGKQHGYKCIHYGGGTTNDANDPLLTFKKKFTKQPLLDFYVAKNIYNEKIYHLLSEKHGSTTSDYFPSYRKP